ncbi:hypothetical protein ABZ070_10185 [Streptomyces sp. NPDC006283]|uniref:hypothetical protein n=1 Tax=Streptomyces sp. NPDC006283 TaxID=3156741 RepID=UPI0033A7EC4F
MGQSDKLLEQLIKRVNQTGALLDITIMVGGAMITGKLAARDDWLKTMSDELGDTSAADFAVDFRSEASIVDSEEYLHMSGGKVMFGTGPLPTKGGLMRVRTSAVDSWMIGRIATK